MCVLEHNCSWVAMYVYMPIDLFPDLLLYHVCPFHGHHFGGQISIMAVNVYFAKMGRPNQLDTSLLESGS